MLPMLGSMQAAEPAGHGGMATPVICAPLVTLSWAPALHAGPARLEARLGPAPEKRPRHRSLGPRHRLTTYICRKVAGNAAGVAIRLDAYPWHVAARRRPQGSQDPRGIAVEASASFKELGVEFHVSRHIDWRRW